MDWVQEHTLTDFTFAEADGHACHDPGDGAFEAAMRDHSNFKELQGQVIKSRMG